ncbi:Ig-like domain-containing protein [Lutimonas zeaxanthinifaciens]|uniref:Ig-like domain-containing protein n=1 Tax=Lutimonas zeaxanthinifaciens TaxID=3060215 RepID=UPI00265D0EC8|nr:Ig-like domain-containing protein [Lutimonas sp. YSD2104]WKK66907.1 Ig-like domain-containing protein [Lutimonas sp. YSD2104]
MKYLYLLIIVAVSFLSSCARMGRPEGGPKDFDKPVMVKSDPELKSINFKEDQIKIYFDEFVKLQNVNTELIISPPLKNAPVISPLGTPSKKITIKISDTLKENTTYTFNFAQSIIDNTEGNILDNFKYIFSTGDYIDSLKIKGQIKDAFDLEMLENPTIMLYPVEESYKDSIVFLEKPTYVGGTLDSLNWEITNIKAGDYRLIALNDLSKNYKFNPKEDKIAFYPEVISIPGDSIFDLKLFKEILPFKVVSRPKDVSKGHVIIGFEGDHREVSIRNLSASSDDFKSFFTKDRKTDTLNYYFNNFELDSMLLEISKGAYLDTITVKINEEEIDSLRIQMSSYGVLHMRDTLKLGASVPLMKIDTSKFHLLDKDSIKVPFQLELKPNRNEMDFDFKKETNQTYDLFIEPGAVEDIFGVMNDTIKSKLKTGKISDYASIYLTLRNVDRYPAIIELMNDKGETVATEYATQMREFEFRYLEPSRFMIRIIYDDNGNKKWDTGNFLLKIQPEEVYYVKTILEAKANWELEENISLQP